MVPGRVEPGPRTIVEEGIMDGPLLGRCRTRANHLTALPDEERGPTWKP